MGNEEGHLGNEVAFFARGDGKLLDDVRRLVVSRTPHGQTGKIISKEPAIPGQKTIGVMGGASADQKIRNDPATLATALQIQRKEFSSE